MKILFLVPYPPNTAPSQRFRFEQYLDSLSGNGHTFEMVSFWDQSSWSILYSYRNNFKRMLGLLRGYWRRVALLKKLHRFDIIFIHREATPLSVPWMEWYIKNCTKTPIIYDFDDAIWMQETSSKNLLVNLVNRNRKVKAICKWSHTVSCGNSYLAAYAVKFNPQVQIIPTTIDTQNYHIPLDSDNRQLTIGWTGSHSTLPYLTPLIPTLKKLQEQHNFVFTVICNHEPDFEMPGLRYVRWTQKDEIKELNSIDIGIMPLPDTDWSRGKCGFKILQYMALEKAAVASAVGVNRDIIQHGQNGLLCYKQPDWSDNLTLLIEDVNLRRKLGVNGRATVERHYSKSAITPPFLSLFDRVSH